MKDYATYLKPDGALALLHEFERVTPTMFREPGFIAEYLNQTSVKTATLNVDNDPCYIIAFRVTSDKGFWVDICKAIKGKQTEKLFAMINQLAKDNGARYIRFTTARHGLIDLATKQGYTAEAVMMTKAVI